MAGENKAKPGRKGSKMVPRLSRRMLLEVEKLFGRVEKELHLDFVGKAC